MGLVGMHHFGGEHPHIDKLGFITNRKGGGKNVERADPRGKMTNVEGFLGVLFFNSLTILFVFTTHVSCHVSFCVSRGDVLFRFERG